MAIASAAAQSTNRDLFIDSQAERQDKDKKEIMGKDSFLTMMVAQLRNQDPLSPMDGTDFTAQLAQFSNLEQQIQANSNLEAIRTVLGTAKDEDNIFDYIGKFVESDGNPVKVSGGKAVSGGAFNLPEAASYTATIYNKDHVQVRQLSSSGDIKFQGTHDIRWDGKDENGFAVQDGEYTYEIIAKDPKGAYVPTTTTSSGMVDGVTSSGGASYLTVEGRLIAPASVERVSLAGGKANAGLGGTIANAGLAGSNANAGLPGSKANAVLPESIAKAMLAGSNMNVSLAGSEEK